MIEGVSNIPANVTIPINYDEAFEVALYRIGERLNPTPEQVTFETFSERVDFLAWSATQVLDAIGQDNGTDITISDPDQEGRPLFTIWRCEVDDNKEFMVLEATMPDIDTTYAITLEYTHTISDYVEVSYINVSTEDRLDETTIEISPSTEVEELNSVVPIFDFLIQELASVQQVQQVLLERIISAQDLLPAAL